MDLYIKYLDFLGSIFTTPTAFNLVKSLNETIYMVAVSAFFAVLFGLPLGVLLRNTRDDGISPSPKINKIIGTIVNIARSFPFLILIILLLPLSAMITGAYIGSTTAILPLVVAAVPFIARLFEGAMLEVDKGLIEAANSMGASKFEITKMILAECLPALINAITITSISLVGYSAMAGVVGGGGLGDLAIRIGYQSYEPLILSYSVAIIIVLVGIIQISGDAISKKIRQQR